MVIERKNVSPMLAEGRGWEGPSRFFETYHIGEILFGSDAA
jgi:hypothetical protein